ncbi:MAG: SpoIID/LytB domain-containing protein [Candidatus Eremiobacteraeota bacterium]|nr:SpoIID/LytB domain-containing protein [Candidatus Eremiobacteraeota bacterium]MBC5806697.1 SpoIID/LytB domain-containing protein [Candidatus Eremiobacteraeota bacterium]MBC5807845.1 SpoIID/LytB domain-containing protein [Candidatus Eremiobacteraeota bacterium]
MRRHAFLVLAGSAVEALSTGGLAAAARGEERFDYPSQIRVRLFAGFDVVRVDVAGDADLDVSAAGLRFSSRRMSVDGPNRSLSSDAGAVGLPADPLVVMSPQAFAVTATFRSGNSVARRYPAALRISLASDHFTIVNLVDVETYVAATLSAEVSSGWPAEALRAHAIAARTYPMRRRAVVRSRDYDVNDDTSSQVYRGVDAIAAPFLSAAQSTSGQILFSAATPASVLYSSACGGHTAAVAEIGGQPVDYLNGIPDVDARGAAYCSHSPYFHWRNSLAASSLARALDASAGDIADVSVSERWPDGRVKTLTVMRTDGSRKLVNGRTFYSRALATLGYKVIPSTLFDVARAGEAFVISGHGVGHGVGMCQWGARGRAEAGMDAAQILAAYFPGTTLRTA